MKLILSILLLLCINFSFAQEGNFALITEPQIGVHNNAANLIDAVEDINKRQDVSYVVVLGNITASGKFDEFLWAQEILDILTVPYSIVGGEKDYLLSEGNGSEISLLWSNDKNIFNNKSYSLVCINSILPEFPGKKFIDMETLSSFNKKISQFQSDRIITFSFYPIISADNSYDFFEPLLSKKIFAFVSKGDKTGNYKSTYEGLYLNRKDGWGYLLASTKKDSMVIKKILSDEIKKKAKPEIVRTIFTKPFILESTKPVKFVQPGSVIWSVNTDKIIRESSVYRSGWIFTSFKNGLVNCLDGNGNERWSFESNKRINISPLVDNDKLVVASDDGDIITVDAKTGDPFQIIGIGEKISSGVSIIEIDEAGNKTKAVVVGSEYGNLYCYDLLTLDPIWTQQLSSIGEDIRIVSGVAHSNNKIFFQDNQGSLYCLSATNGMLIWNIQASKGGWKSGLKNSGLRQRDNLIVRNNNLYLIDVSGNLFCVDALLGTSKWNINNIYATGEIVVNGQNEFILPTTKNKIAFVSTKLGKVTSEIELPIPTKDESISDLLVLGDKIIVGFSDGWVYEIKAKQTVEKFFRSSYAPIISLTEVDGNCLVTNYDGKFSLLNISASKK
jgi:outer membrane protein assembly factor BamB